MADGSARVRLAGARYPVPMAWARCEVQARVGVDGVELRCQGVVVTAPRQPRGQDHAETTATTCPSCSASRRRCVR